MKGNGWELDWSDPMTGLKGYRDFVFEFLGIRP